MSNVNKLRKWPAWDDLVADGHKVARKGICHTQEQLDSECRRIAAGRKYAVRNIPNGWDVTSENGDIVFGQAMVQ
jgi:hypothetical protein